MRMNLRMSISIGKLGRSKCTQNDIKRNDCAQKGSTEGEKSRGFTTRITCRSYAVIALAGFF